MRTDRDHNCHMLMDILNLCGCKMSVCFHCLAGWMTVEKAWYLACVYPRSFFLSGAIWGEYKVNLLVRSDFIKDAVN